MPAPSEKSGGAVFWGSLLVLATIAGFTAGGVCVYLYVRDSNAPGSPGEDDAARPGVPSDEVPATALGRIEPRDGILFLGVPTPDRIAKILVKEGQRVPSGKQLVELESEALRQLEEKASEIQREGAMKRLEAIQTSGKAQIDVEQLRLKQVEKFGPVEIELQKRKIQFLQSQLANAERDYERLKNSGDTIAVQQKDKQRLLWEQAQEGLATAQTQLQKLLDGHPLDIELAKARVVAARAEMERGQSTISVGLLNNQTAQANTRLAAARITAPCDGTILRVLAHPGDLVQGKPIVQMANTDRMIVLAEVYEGDIEHVKRGQTATITSDIGHIFQKDKNALTGKVIEIAGIVGMPQVVSADPLAAVDRRVVEVKVELNLSKDQAENVAKLIGHQVRVYIYTKTGDRVKP